ncbi:hypothetical protein [Pelistega ratti]|uniref:hypothetical protein n=1 Tax=Pelistega ratti TaxID=2652177 RepID=UPI001359D2B1|nr:hypothetical protein [Pelistega ratti]
MNDNDVKKLFSTTIMGMNGKELGDLVTWFSRTPFDRCLAIFNYDKKKLKILENIISIPTEIDIKSYQEKLESLREYIV